MTAFSRTRTTDNAQYHLEPRMFITGSDSCIDDVISRTATVCHITAASATHGGASLANSLAIVSKAANAKRPAPVH
ncbi:hypothetical protein PsYK624_125290 [Phanerochaete sordida]|uniref:Uncharacterized protein n=1 Tax=Phanerochaete sordida TaxID=48140 RepID=A0A9P3GJK0_9APHY|nr:hypothetical protein PsYK624_125290 [Phanerochaete sordida]